jgi:hypothetical protein
MVFSFLTASPQVVTTETKDEEPVLLEVRQEEGQEQEKSITENVPIDTVLRSLSSLFDNKKEKDAKYCISVFIENIRKECRTVTCMKTPDYIYYVGQGGKFEANSRVYAAMQDTEIVKIAKGICKKDNVDLEVYYNILDAGMPCWKWTMTVRTK